MDVLINAANLALSTPFFGTETVPLLSSRAQGLLQRAPEAPAPGEDFSQLLCFSEEAAAEAAAEARRRSAAARRPGARQSSGGGVAGSPLGVEGVEEWCQRQEAVVLVNNGQFVSFPVDPAGSPASVRPVTAVTVAG
jgi:hypothetical protein